MDLRDEGTLKPRASVKTQSKRRVRVKIKGNSHCGELREGLRRHLEIWKRHLEVKDIRTTTTNTIEKPSIGRLVCKIIHCLIEADVLSSLDSLSDSVIVQHILHSLGEAKEDTNACIGGSTLGTTGTSRESIDTTTKDTEQTKVGFVTHAHLERRGSIIAVHSDVVQPKEVLKRIRPELGRKVGTS